jgi:hypothetical protein
VSESISGTSLKSIYMDLLPPPPPDGGFLDTIIVYPYYIPQPPIKATFDHPFFFIIKDLDTGTILFMGKMMDPTNNSMILSNS